MRLTPLILRHVRYPDGAVRLECRQGAELPNGDQVFQYLFDHEFVDIIGFETLLRSELKGTLVIRPIRLH